MFDPGTANQIMDTMWGTEDRTLPTVKAVRDALKGKGGGSTFNISVAVWNWKVRHGLAGPAAKARTFEAASLRSKTARKPPWAAAREQVDAHVREELARMTHEATKATDRLGQVEERVQALKEHNEHLLAQVEERLQVVQADNERIRAEIEELFQVLGAGDGRLFEQVMTSRRQRAIEFWPRLKAVVAEIVQEHEHLTLHGILEMIPGDMVEEARASGVRLDHDTFFENMVSREPAPAMNANEGGRS